MKPFKIYLIAILLALLTSYGAHHFWAAPTSSSARGETAFARIVKTNQLRCGYAVATPWFMADPVTGEFSGYAHDAVMAIAQKIGLTVVWAEETGWGVAEQGLQTGRYDMMCGTVCVDPKRIKAALYSKPLMHAPIFAVARADDHRFDQGHSAADQENIRIGVKTGHVFEYAAQENFPAATKIYANDISDDVEFLLMLESKKIDLAFAGQATIDLYQKQNGAVIKAVGDPVRYCNGALMMAHGEYELQQMMNAAITELNASKAFDRIAAKYMPLDPRYIRMPAQDFREE